MAGKKMTMKAFEASAADKKADAKSGAKEGGKADAKQDAKRLARMNAANGNKKKQIQQFPFGKKK